MSNIPSSGGVRSLLAKFENNKQDSTSPPSRGRSPAAAEDTTSVRPLSKVRASFVSVEKNGQNNLSSGVGKLKDSEGFDKENSQRSATGSPVGVIEKSTETSPSAYPQRVRTGLAALQGNGIGNMGENLMAASESNRMPKASVSDKPSSQATPNVGQKGSIANKSKEGSGNGNETPQNKQLAATKSVTKRPSTVSLARDVSSSKLNAKASPIKDQKSVATPPKPSTASASHRTPNVERAASTRTPKTSTPSTINGRTKTPSQDNSKQRTLHSSPNSNVLQRSPTRPVRLPASMTAPTAASAAKTGSLSRSQSHANINSSPKTLTRKPSTLKTDTTSRLTAPTTSNLRRQPSRQSLPVHSQSPNDRPKSRVSMTSSRATHEESFLARMMRPTASSASKVHEKIDPRTPPKVAHSSQSARKSGDSLPDKRPPSSSTSLQAEAHPETALAENDENSKEEKVIPVTQPGLSATEKDSAEEPIAKHIAKTQEGFETVHEEPLQENTDEVHEPVEAVAADGEKDVPEKPSSPAPVTSEILHSPQLAAGDPADKIQKDEYSGAVVEETTNGDVVEPVEKKPVVSETSNPVEATSQPEPGSESTTEHLESAKSLDPIEAVKDAASEDDAESAPVVDETKTNASESTNPVEATNELGVEPADSTEHSELAKILEPIELVKETAGESNAESIPAVDEVKTEVPKDIPEAVKASSGSLETVIAESVLEKDTTEEKPEHIDEGVD